MKNEDTEQNQDNTQDAESDSVRRVVSPPNFFCGWSNTEEDVQGGTGVTIEDAICDYVDNHAHFEIINSFLSPEATEVELEVEICSVISPLEAKRQWGGEAVHPDWKWCVDKKVETRKLKFTYSTRKEWVLLG